MTEKFMSIIGAIESMQSGKWVCRKRWKNNCMLIIRNVGGISEFSMRSNWADENPVELSAEDVLATDWLEAY